MKYKYLGNSGLVVSSIALGTLTFGEKNWGCNEKEAFSVLNKFKEIGGNFIDTADQYNKGLSEIIVGNWLKQQQRDDFVIATKCFFPTNNNINNRGLSRKHIISACNNSLKRLQTDYIDLYQVYGVDPKTPLEETLDTLNFLIKQGKVRYLGLSNYPAWKITKSYYLAEQNKTSKFIAGQYLYNLLKREIETDIIPASMDANMSIICWSPLSGGMLTGKYTNPHKPIDNSRFSKREDLAKDRYGKWFRDSIDTIQKIQDIANKYQKTSSIIALSWLLRNPQIASAIVGARNINQIEENCKAADWLLPEEDYRELNNLKMVKNIYPYDWLKNNQKDWFKNIL